MPLSVVAVIVAVPSDSAFKTPSSLSTEMTELSLEANVKSVFVAYIGVNVGVISYLPPVTNLYLSVKEIDVASVSYTHLTLPTKLEV